MKMHYLIVIHKDENSDFGVTVPDLPGCYTAGSSIEEATKNAHEAIECHLEGLLLDNEPIPLKKPVEQHLDNPDFKDAVLALVDIDFSTISGKTIRINVSLPERFLRQIDEYVRQQGANRSEFLVDAAMNFMAKHPIIKSVNYR
jgi:predicted RNase H-like HicB family nuclease